MASLWTRDSWRNFPILQQPDWSDIIALSNTIKKLKELPALVFSGETRRLKSELANVNKGDSFILHVGNCSESFSDCNGPKIHNFLRIILQMAMVLNINSGKKIIKLGRVAGQYAKPRSNNYETINEKRIPVYRGDIVNDFNPTLDARQPEIGRLLEGYFRSAATLNLIRAFTQGGYSDIDNLLDWKEHFYAKEISALDYYKKLEKKLTKSIANKEIPFNCNQGDIIYISHEALLLDYEEAFARIDTTTGDYYSTSAHSLWIGDRTRQPEGAHIEFARGIANPIGVKIGPSYEFEKILNVINKLNPENEGGKIMLIVRMGKNKILDKLPILIRGIKRIHANVIWCCDPMHGNTFKHANYKVRSFDDIISETKLFFEICNIEKVVPGGIHLEITGEYVSECVGGITGLKLDDLKENYETKVDPRLNAAQALETSFILSELL